jgi:hypothetical protein
LELPDGRHIDLPTDSGPPKTSRTVRRRRKR